MDSCTEWRELGPPPDSIMDIPPPPIPLSLEIPNNLNNLTLIPCSLLCDANNGPKVEFIDLAMHSRFDGVWVMLIASFCIGILCFGTLFAVILLKFRRDFTGSKEKITSDTTSESGGSCEAVLYPGGADTRAIWATLTPRGPTTFVAPINKYEKSLYNEPDDNNKPKVSCPTRIEHPNLPPLNLHRTLRKNKENNAPVV